MKASGLLLSIVMAVLPFTAKAAPVRPSAFKVTQPDGRQLELTVIGDEFGHITRTADGIAVVRDNSGAWRYAVTADAGHAIAGQTLAHDRKDRSISEQKMVAAINQRAITGNILGTHRQQSSIIAGGSSYAQPGDYALTHFKRSGSPKVLVVFIEFPDKRFSKDSQTMRSIYNQMYNEHGLNDTIIHNGNIIINNSGSVREYFEAQSYGIFSPSFDIIGPIMADSSYVFYGHNDNGVDGNDYRNAQVLANEACRKIISGRLADLSDYDSDSDGTVDMMAIIYAGQGENYAGSDPNTIWPNSWSLRINSGTIRSVNYFLTCELFWDSNETLDGIGIFCHEFSHTLGLPDYYYTNDYSGINESQASIGRWSIMDFGTYDNDGFSPIGYSAFERFSLGWLSLTDISRAGTYSLQDLNTGQGKAYRIPCAGSSDACCILEYRKKEGWFRYQASEGLMVTAVNYSRSRWAGHNVNISPTDKGYYILPADNDYNRKSSYGDLFPYNGKDSISAWSEPALSVCGRYWPVFNIYGIGYQGSDMTFTLAKECPTAVQTATKDSETEIFDIAGRRQNFTEADMSRGIWIVVKDGKTRKVQVR